ncbi:fimbrial protein [Serratia silvae]|uniref:Type 1 fimbrial protein n=1 Tax=Serratia silvae TaxID=2824122 RepID=A0ABT0K7T1_9GAMM|nr:fimbrial protein [Serratia silvae]MCL1027784.1 type 1 fimbrial protein [Serratia silvae]
MKKLTIVASLIAVFGTVGLAQAASTGTITFNGELTANTCDVSIDGQPTDATVILPTVSTGTLNTANRTAGDTRFMMALTNCADSTQTASAFFQAGATVDSNGRLINGGTASQVSLQLLDGSSSTQEVIKIGSQDQVAKTVYNGIVGGSASLPYIVRYYAEGATTAGTVISNVVYSIQYQ